MDSVRETFSALWATLTSRWYWFIVAAAALIVAGPYFMLMLIISLPPPWNAITVFLLIGGWGVAAGYKDWIIFKSKEEKRIKR